MFLLIHVSVPAPSRRLALGQRWPCAFSACSPRMPLFEQETSRPFDHNTTRTGSYLSSMSFTIDGLVATGVFDAVDKMKDTGRACHVQEGLHRRFGASKLSTKEAQCQHILFAYLRVPSTARPLATLDVSYRHGAALHDPLLLQGIHLLAFWELETSHLVSKE